MKKTSMKSLGLVVGGALWAGTAMVLVVSVAPLSEPNTMLLIGTGLAGLAGVSQRKNGQKV